MKLIEKLAREQNFTVSLLAREVGVTRPTIYAWFGGQEPTISDVIKLAKVLKTTPVKIFKDYIK